MSIGTVSPVPSLLLFQQIYDIFKGTLRRRLSHMFFLCSFKSAESQLNKSLSECVKLVNSVSGVLTVCSLVVLIGARQIKV